MKIGLKLILGFLVVALLVGVVGYVGVKVTNTTGHAFDSVAEETIPKIEALGDLRFAGIKIVAATKGRIKAAPAEIAQEEKEIKEGKEKYNNALRRYGDVVNRFSPEKKEFLEKIRISGEKLQKASAEIIELKEQEGPAVLEAKEFEKSERAFLNAVNDALAYENGEFAERKRSIDSIIATTINTVYIVGITTFIIAILIGIFISRSISKPIQELTKASTELKKGNLNYEIKIKSKDEIGELAETFDEMRIQLKQRESLAVKDRNELLNSILNSFKGKAGNIAMILMRKNVQDLVKKNPRIMKMLPEEMVQVIKKGEELKKGMEPNEAAKQNPKGVKK